MRYIIADTHRYWKKKQKEALMNFFMQVRNLEENEAYEAVDYIDRYEKEFAVKCFEAIAYDKGCIVGFMRCFRNPEDISGWFVADINVLPDYRKKNVATKLYEMVIEEVSLYDYAEYIEASVKKSNIPSINLHKKVGFIDTNKAGKFASFYFEEDETFFRRTIYSYLPVGDTEAAMDFLLPLWFETIDSYKSEKDNPLMKYDLHTLLKLSEDGKMLIRTVWHGENLAGLYISDGTNELEYIDKNR